MSIEQYACELFTTKFGRRIDTRFSKLEEEYTELKEAYAEYTNNTGSFEHVLDEISDVEAVLMHIRMLLSDKTHDVSILDAVVKVKVREHNKEYKK